MLQHIHLSSERKKATVSYSRFCGISVHVIVLGTYNKSRFMELYQQKWANLPCTPLDPRAWSLAPLVRTASSVTLRSEGGNKSLTAYYLAET